MSWVGTGYSTQNYMGVVGNYRRTRETSVRDNRSWVNKYDLLRNNYDYAIISPYFKK